MKSRIDLQARLEAEGRPAIEGRVVDVEKAVLEVEFAEGCPPVGITERVRLVLQGDDLPRPFIVHPRVISWSVGNGTCRYEFRLGLEEAKPLAILFNPRAAFRVLPALHPIVEVEIHPIGEMPNTVVATLKDVSVSGISVLVSIEEERQKLFKAKKVKLAVDLPGMDDKLTMIGNVRYRRLVGSLIRYGIEFDPDATPAFTHKQQKLSEYVVRRQVEQIRDGNETTPRR